MSRKGIPHRTILDAAAAAADDVGLESLTLAMVAERLGIRSPSLYNHVRGLPGLRRELSLMAAEVLAAEISRAMEGAEGVDALVRAGGAIRTLAKERPGLYACLVQAPDPKDADMVRASEGILRPLYERLDALGFRGAEAVHRLRSLRSAVHGFALLESHGGFGLPVDLEDSFAWMVRRLAQA